MKTNYVYVIFSCAAKRIGIRQASLSNEKEKTHEKGERHSMQFQRKHCERIRTCVYCVTFINVENSSAGHLAFFIVSFARRFVIDPFRVYWHLVPHFIMIVRSNCVMMFPYSLLLTFAFNGVLHSFVEFPYAKHIVRR